jgi:molybdopterin synthase catalytic subunit
VSPSHGLPDALSDGVFAAIVTEVIDVPALLEAAAHHGDGAQAVFVGVVRDHAGGRAVSGMRYEGYEPMATRVLRAIAGEARERWEVTSVQVVHRLGELTLGEASVAIVVGSPHRGPAFEASRYVIEEIKKRLPVWKHEHFADGEARWVPGQALEVGP